MVSRIIGFFIIFVINITANGLPRNETAVFSIIKKSGLKKNNFGIWVGNGKKVPFHLNANRLFIPASITKIITSFVVMEQIGFKKSFISTFRAEGKLVESHLNGSLCFVGGGLPGFTSEKLWNLVNELERTGVKTIVGDLIVDSSYFTQEPFPEGRRQKRVDRAYDAPVSAASFNWNAVNIFIRPRGEGESAKVSVDPESDYYVLKNSVRTTAKKTALAVKTHSGKVNSIDVTGSIRAGASEKVYYKPVKNPNLWTGAQIKAFLLRRGISFSGKIVSRKCSSSSLLLADIESKPIDLILRDLMKYSNNYIAEMLTLHLAKKGSQFSTVSHGVGIIKKFLKRKGWSEKDFFLESPSGLSRKNVLKPNLLGKLLIDIQEDIIYSATFKNSLPIGGVDGTLKKRFMRGPAFMKVRAKTGMLNGVAALAGYFEGKNKKQWPFVIIYNGKNHYKAKSTIDKIVAYFVQEI